MTVPPVTDPSRSFIGTVAVELAEGRAGGCVRPVRLRGSTMLVDTATGEVFERYSSADELDGYTYVRCGNRRASVCPTCSHEYKGDAWHLLVCGLAGGKGVPAAVAEHPCTFATLTAPSFGAVHGLRQKGPCRARRDKPVCPHGRPLWCGRRHSENDDATGAAAVLGVLRLHRPRAVAVARSGAVAPIHYRAPTPTGRRGRTLGQGVQGPLSGGLFEGGRVPGPGTDPRARPDQT